MKEFQSRWIIFELLIFGSRDDEILLEFRICIYGKHPERIQPEAALSELLVSKFSSSNQSSTVMGKAKL